MAALLAAAVTFPSVAQLDAANAASARAATVETPPAAPDFEDALRRLSVGGHAVFVPIIGRIGIDLVPDGFEALVAHRERFRKATAIVVELDSDGGTDAAARRIAVALQQLGEQTPVIIVVRRAIGPAAMILTAAHRVFILEPAPSGTIIAFQPELDPLQEMTIDESVDRFSDSMEQLLEHAPRRDALEAMLASKSQWSLTSRDAYALGVAEPLEGGLASLGRTMRIEPWVVANRQVEDLLRRSTVYAQQVSVYRSRVTARAFMSLESANLAMAQMTAAEFAAASVDPRLGGAFPWGYRAEPAGDRWTVTLASTAAWQRACEGAAAAWLRVAVLGDTAQQALRNANADVAALIAGGVSDASQDQVLAEAIDRLERERSEVESRVAAIQARVRAARDESEAIAALAKR